MPGSDLDLVSRRLETALGPLEIALPVGAALKIDPGAIDGKAWYWLPQPGAGVLTISEGSSDTLTAAALLTLERSLENIDVTVLSDLSADAEGELTFVTSRKGPGTVTIAGGGLSHADLPAQRARYRFFERHGSTLRIGYRVEEAAAGEWQVRLDRVVDSARLI